MDLLLWFAGKRCKNITSYGDLTFFKEENAPENSAEKCMDCGVEKDCPYSAPKLYYLTMGGWPATVITHDQTREGIYRALKEGPYGRCVFRCDNNVVDHQVTSMEFEDGVTATFNLSAFTNSIHRTLKIMGTKGEIRADDGRNEIEIERFGEFKKVVISPMKLGGGHGGGDHGIMEDFISLIETGKGKALTSADVSVESHIMAFAAEESRVSNKSINLKEYYEKF
jgi:predicted dehydrogenase